MPVPLDPDDERGLAPTSDDVVVLVDGRSAAAALRPPARRSADRGRSPARPSVSSAGVHDDVAGPTPATAVAGGDGRRPVMATAAPAPARAPSSGPSGRRAWKPGPGRDQPEGSFLSRHLRVPGPLGLVVVVLALAMGTGLVGAYVWARNDAHNIRTSPVSPPPAPRSATTGDTEVTTTTKPDLSADTLVEKLGPSVWTVRTFDSAGQPVQGSALLTQSNRGQGLLLTSLAVVEASTHQPAPEITVSGGGFNGKAQLFTWDQAHDLALLVVSGVSTRALDWVPDSSTLKAGDKVFALGGDGKLKPGLVTALSDQAVEHNVFVDDALRGGPIVNVKGEVVAVSSAAYTAGGTPTDAAFFGVPIRLSCSVVLTCTGAFAGPGTEVASTPSSPDSTTTTTTEPG